MPVILVLGRAEEENHEFKANLGYRLNFRPMSIKHKQNKQQEENNKQASKMAPSKKYGTRQVKR